MSNDVHVGGIGFTGLLAVLFIGLKLGGVIDWSWWWVLAPLWAGFAIILGIALLVGVGALFVAMITTVFGKKPKRNIRR